MKENKEHILVIRLGALGDLAFCFQAFADIRAAHPQAEIALLVRSGYADFMSRMPWFDRIIVDPQAKATEPSLWLGLRRVIRDFAPTRVYDFQGKTRQSILYGLLGGPWGPEWSGAAPGCALPRPWPPAPTMHFADFLAAQLRAAQVPAASPVDLSFLDADVGKFNLTSPYVVLIPGCSPKAVYKRWPPTKYAQLSDHLRARGLTVVIVGGKDDAEAAAEIASLAPACVDLTQRTNLFELAGLLRRAVAVIGNDTGPLHMAARIGTPTLALLSGRTKAAWSHPVGEQSAWRQSEILADLSVGSVLSAFESLSRHPKGKGTESKTAP